MIYWTAVQEVDLPEGGNDILLLITMIRAGCQRNVE
jgi:hypothetical protein